jgi:hypothetical protein
VALLSAYFLVVCGTKLVGMIYFLIRKSVQPLYKMACKEDSEYDVTSTDSDENDRVDLPDEATRGLITPSSIVGLIADFIAKPSMCGLHEHIQKTLDMEIKDKTEMLNHLRDIRNKPLKQSAEVVECLRKCDAAVEVLEEELKTLQKQIGLCEEHKTTCSACSKKK